LDELLLVNNALEEIRFKTDQPICDADSLVNDLFIIQRGNVIVENENQKIELHSKDYFGEMALFDYAPLSVTMVAKTNCTILKLSREKFNNLLEVCPRLLLCYSQLS
jgi:CRP-like cAMP-binding protein